MTTRLVFAGLLTLLTASIAVGKPALQGAVDQQDTSPPDSTKPEATSLDRTDIQKPQPESKEIELAWDAWHKRFQ